MFKSPFVVFFFATLICFVACVKNPQDTDDPILTLFQSDDVQTVSTGESVNFSISCVEDVALASVEWEISYTLSPEYNLSGSFDVIGQELSFNSGVVVDTDSLIAQEATITIFCKDEMDNVSNADSFTFFVVNGLDGSGPEIVLEEVDGVALDSLENGIELSIETNFDFEGFVTDESLVEKVYIYLANDTDSIYADTLEIVAPVDTLFFNEIITTTPFPGEYDFRIEAQDGNLNWSSRSYPVTIE